MMNPEMAELSEALRILGSKHRIGILYALARGSHSAAEIGAEVGLSQRAASRHLRVLRSHGLVKLQPESGNGRAYSIDSQRVAVLNATLFSIANWATDLEPTHPEALSLVTPDTPDRCLTCQNASFVREVLDDLNESVKSAREYQVRLKQMSAQVLSAQEEERKRIARELHDETAQALTSVLVRVRILEKSGGKEELGKALGELRDLTADTLEGVRRMAVDLRPPVLDDLGVEAALSSHVEEFSRRWSNPVELDCGRLNRLSPAVGLIVYRIVQEALSNVARHASAAKAAVRVIHRNGLMRVEIEDDGVGFDVKLTERPQEAGLGIFGMEERASLLGGTLTIDSTPDRGTTVVAEIPLGEQGQG